MAGEQGYLSLLDRVLREGEDRPSRAGPVKGLFDVNLRFSLEDGTLPFLTVRKISPHIVISELLMFLRGRTDSRAELESKGVNIWKGNTAATGGDLGPMYGYQWRHFGGEYRSAGDHDAGRDTWAELLDGLEKDPFSRRHILTTLNMGQVHQGVLFPCHGVFIQFYVSNDRRLSLKMTQRSADIFHGLPYNTASYSLLLHVVIHLLEARNCFFLPGTLSISIGDAHLYANHEAAARALIERAPLPSKARPAFYGRATCVEELNFGVDGYSWRADPLPDAPFNA